jgi:DNA-binding CsgD family transcriptional regulator
MAPRSREDDLRADAAQVPGLIREAPKSGVTADHWDVRHDISGRELEIIELLATGQTNQEIASQLMISKRTVDNHVSNIFTKTGAKNRVALLNWAMDNGKICRDGFNCCHLEPPPSQS